MFPLLPRVSIGFWEANAEYAKGQGAGEGKSIIYLRQRRKRRKWERILGSLSSCLIFSLCFLCSLLFNCLLNYES